MEENYYSLHRDERLQYQKQYYKENKEDILKRQRQYFKIYYQKNKEKIDISLRGKAQQGKVSEILLLDNKNKIYHQTYQRPPKQKPEVAINFNVVVIFS